MLRFPVRAIAHSDSQLIKLYQMIFCLDLSLKIPGTPSLRHDFLEKFPLRHTVADQVKECDGNSSVAVTASNGQRVCDHR